MKPTKRRRKWISYAFVFILPSFVLYTVFVVVPTLGSIYLSFTSWNGVSPDLRFIGFDNFVEMWHSYRVRNAFRNTIVLSALLTILTNAVALVLAVLVDQARWLRNFFRSAFYLPVLIGGIVTGFIWTIIFNYNFGVINQVLEQWGLDQLRVDWLGNSDYSLYSIVVAMVWQSAGYYMIIYLAALQGVPQELTEAARMDGANRWVQFKHVVFPLLAGAVTICLTLTLINSLKLFDQIAVMTDGGPGFATETLTYIIYKVGFAEQRQGFGTALAFVLFILILVVSVILLKYLRKREVQL